MKDLPTPAVELSTGSIDVIDVVADPTLELETIK
jgi:hypothetical protein